MQTETLNALAPYDALRANIEKMRNENANRTFQYETPKGNKLARSHVAELRTVKAQLEAIDNGLLEPFAVFMPYMQLKDGRTVSEAAKEQGIGKFLSGTLALGQPALPAPEDAA